MLDPKHFFHNFIPVPALLFGRMVLLEIIIYMYSVVVFQNLFIVTALIFRK